MKLSLPWPKLTWSGGKKDGLSTAKNSRRELEAVLRRLGNEELGTIVAIVAKAKEVASEEEKFMEAFKMFDGDGDGSITAEELHGVMVAADAAGGADAEGRGTNLSTVVGIATASSAVTMLAAAAVTPPVAFGTFLLLLGGLFVAISGVLEN